MGTIRKIMVLCEEHPEGSQLETCKCKKLVQSLLSGVLVMDSGLWRGTSTFLSQEEMLVVILK